MTAMRRVGWWSALHGRASRIGAATSIGTSASRQNIGDTALVRWLRASVNVGVFLRGYEGFARGGALEVRGIRSKISSRMRPRRVVP